MNGLKKASLFFRTVRHLSARQIACRGVRIVRRRIWAAANKNPLAAEPADLRQFAPLYAGLRECGGMQSEPEVESACARAESVARREFTFLNLTCKFECEIGWNDPNLSQLWRYHLHYFSYVRDLLLWAALGERQRAYNAFRDVAESWIRSNNKIVGDGWHPYTLSLRLANWSQAVAYFDQELTEDEAFRTLIGRSLYRQAEVLFVDLEFDVRGNHLIENLRGLIWATQLFEGASSAKWLKTALAVLEVETAAQVLKDGGHFERTPGYHFVVLKDYVEMAVSLKRNVGVSFEWLDSAIARLMDYGIAILGPTDEVPLLKDTALDAAPNPMTVLASGALYLNDARYKRSERLPVDAFLIFGSKGRESWEEWKIRPADLGFRHFQNTQHVVWRPSVQDFLIMDLGKPCPEYLPAHGQADMFTFELWVDSQKIICDSGVYEYTAGDWRSYFRSTRAHNTVELDGADQSEVWASFRVGRRAVPRNVKVKRQNDRYLVQGEHNGYRALGADHRRTLSVEPGGHWIVLDEVRSRRAVRARDYLHFHPSIRVGRVPGTESWQIEREGTRLWVHPFGHDRVEVVEGRTSPRLEGWYSEEFGTLQPAPTLVLEKACSGNSCFGYVVSRLREVSIGVSQCNETGAQVVISLGTQVQRLFTGDLQLRVHESSGPIEVKTPR